MRFYVVIILQKENDQCPSFLFHILLIKNHYFHPLSRLIDAVPCETGGTLNKIRSSLKYLCPSEHIPSKIEVDVSSLDIGDAVSMHDAKVHPSLKLLSKNETMPVCKIMAAQSDYYKIAPDEV